MNSSSVESRVITLRGIRFHDEAMYTAPGCVLDGSFGGPMSRKGIIVARVLINSDGIFSSILHELVYKSRRSVNMYGNA